MTSEAVPTGFSIADAAERAGLTTHALRYYERDGLMLRTVERSASGHRRYTEHDLQWITLITRLRATGMPIREIRAYAALCREGEGNEMERLALLEAHRQRVLDKLSEVTEHLGAIDRKIGIYVERLEAVAAAPAEPVDSSA
jgi:DNA-binding transcriptional MerR regulator